jgi:hypothetical protein
MAATMALVSEAKTTELATENYRRQKRETGKK